MELYILFKDDETIHPTSTTLIKLHIPTNVDKIMSDEVIHHIDHGDRVPQLKLNSTETDNTSP